MARELVKDFYGKIIGSTEQEGTRTVVRDFYGRILGYYESKEDVTKDLYGRIISRGNTAIGLLYKGK